VPKFTGLIVPLGPYVQRDELHRRDAAPVGVVPAHERLDGDHLAGLDVHDRLVLDHEVALLDGLRELFLEIVAADDRVAHLGREDGEAPLAALLGLVHGDVGVAQELVGGGAVALGGGDADRQRHVERLLAGLHGREEAVERTLGEFDGALLDVLVALHEHGKLVAAEARDHVLLAHGPQEP
jgi:hypothetical protein